jgi:hypothetical protein
VAEQKDAYRMARDEGFLMGTIAALACTHAQGADTLWGEIVRAAGTQDVLRHALTHEGDWTWGGFDRHAVAELGRDEVARARRAVRARQRASQPMDPARVRELAAATTGVALPDGGQTVRRAEGER